MSDPRPFVHDMKNYLGIIIEISNLLLEELPPEDPRRTDIDEIRQAGESAITLLEQWSIAGRGEEAK